MAWWWPLVGSAVLIVGYADIFLSVFNYTDAGFLHEPVCRAAWRVMRTLFARLPTRARRFAFRQVAGLQMLLVIIVWLVFLITGYGLIYYGLLAGLQVSGPDLGRSITAVLYYSFAQLATVGSSQLTPATDVLRMLSIAETMTGLALVGAIVTFLLGNFAAVRDLNTLSAALADLDPAPDAVDPVASLAPYFATGHGAALDEHLTTLYDHLTAYAEGLRGQHLVYYFKSGREHFSLPYLIHMLGGTIAALRWALPAGIPGPSPPALTKLHSAFDRLTGFLAAERGWRIEGHAVPVGERDFTLGTEPGTGVGDGDLWVGRFRNIDAAMQVVTGAADSVDPQAAYQRYRHWLPFAARADRLVREVARDLDDQQFTRGAAQCGELVAPVGARVLGTRSAPPQTPQRGTDGGTLRRRP